jgi:hypothetical protein
MFAAFESLATSRLDRAGDTGIHRRQMESMLATDGIYGLVAEQDGNVVGSAFADERGQIVGSGPSPSLPTSRAAASAAR